MDGRKRFLSSILKAVVVLASLLFALSPRVARAQVSCSQEVSICLGKSRSGHDTFVCNQQFSQCNAKEAQENAARETAMRARPKPAARSEPNLSTADYGLRCVITINAADTGIKGTRAHYWYTYVKLAGINCPRTATLHYVSPDRPSTIVDTTINTASSQLMTEGGPARLVGLSP
jgi:hypothetical protein